MTRLLTTLLIFILIGSALHAGELYLLKIKNAEELESIKSVVDHAYGRIDGKFIVELDYAQVEKLDSLNISLELLASDYTRGSYYLLLKEASPETKTPIAISPVYETANAFIVKLQPGSEQILGREGYMMLPIGSRETPLFTASTGGVQTVILDNYPTDTLADYVDIDSLYSYDLRMEQFYTRFIGSDSAAVANNWLKEKFMSFGYTGIQMASFGTGDTWCGSYSGRNIICVKEGSEQPDKVIVVGGHFDSIRYPQSCYDESAYSPGADDNGSGVSAVLELARIFRNFDNKKTFIFVGWGGEELGLCGSHQMALNMYDDNIDIELVVNQDMIGYVEDTIPDIKMVHNYCDPYRDLFMRYTENILGYETDLVQGANASDDASFMEFGYPTIALEEGDFNYAGWHTGADRALRLDFDYMRTVVQTMVASVAVVDQSPNPLEFTITDVGDGHSIRLDWESIDPNSTYTIIYGPFQTMLTDTIEVPAGNESIIIDGFVDGLPFYLGAYHTVNGFPQMTYTLVSGKAQVIPRVPTGLVVGPDSVSITVSWKANTELDINHYKLFKKAGDNDWAILLDDYTDLEYIDTDVAPRTTYGYRLIAIDNDGNESDTTDVVECQLVSFDGGLILVDETQEGGVNPSEVNQSFQYYALLYDYGLEVTRLDNPGDPLSQSILGLRSPMFYVDDDYDINHLLGDYIDTLNWYFDYENDMFIAGWTTLHNITGNSYLYEGDFIYDEFGLTYINMCTAEDFIGATGDNGWPDLELRPDAPFNGRLPDMQVFYGHDNAQVIYRYVSFMDHEYCQGAPIGITYDTYHGKRVVLGFPLYWMTEASAKAMIAKVFEFFAEESPPLNGDVNLDWAINILDVTYLIQYLYLDGPAPVNMNGADANGDCSLNIIDITRLISYLYQNGPAPVEGCVE